MNRNSHHHNGHARPVDTVLQSFDDYQLYIGDQGSNQYSGVDGDMNIAFGRSGNDRLFGRSMDDDLIGGDGNDHLTARA